MKIEAGKYYRNEKGTVYGPMQRRDADDCGSPVSRFPWTDGSGLTWQADGRYVFDSETNADDLVAQCDDRGLELAPDVAAAQIAEALGAPVAGQLTREILNGMAARIHAANKHFYRDLATGAPIGNVGEKIALIHSETSEMLEYARKGGNDKHLPNRPGEEVEAADILIRLLDYCAWRGLDIGGATVEKLMYNKTRADHTREARLAAGGKKF